jgi:hypothetical protein
MINQLDRETIVNLRKEMEAAMQVVAAKHGIVIKFGNCKFSPENASFKLDVATKAQNGSVITREATAFKQSAVYYGLKSEDLGKVFTFNGKTFKLTGLLPKSRKYPFQATCLQDGKSYKLPESIASLLK